MKKISVLFIAALSLLLCSCSRNEIEGEFDECVISQNTTWYEDGMFYETANSEGEPVLCYYSKTNDRSAVMCGMPECTHAYKTSPGCGALKERDTFTREGYNRVGDKLYFLALQSPTENSTGSLDFIECDIDGKNQRLVASIENTSLAFINTVKYIDGHVLFSYYQNCGFVEDENTGKIEFVNYEKYKFYIKRIDISTGNVETLVSREEYNGRGGGTVYQNTLYYNYSYNIEPPTGELLTFETAPKSYSGFYIRDLSTGEEKGYKDISAMGESYEYFSPDGIICYDSENDKLCRFVPETETFNNIAHYNMNGYTADGKNALFIQSSDSEYWTGYDFETGELTQLQPYAGDFDIHPNLTHTVGNTVWLEVVSADDSSLRHAYIDRNDFFAGKFEIIKLIKEVEL